MIYTVKKGDNLTRIAKAYGVTVAEIAAANSLADPNKIRVGQALEIPLHEPPFREHVTGGILADFLGYLEDQLGHIYVWGAQGQVVSAMDDPIDWIADRETNAKNVEKASAFYAKRKKEGMDPIRAFDCSGLVMFFVQNKNKLVDSDMSARGIYSACDPLKREELQPGDLVFRHDGKKIHHVGVYIGEDLVIEAKGRADGVVKRDIDASGKGYWNRYGRWSILLEGGH